jgi:hypothetical protein
MELSENETGVFEHAAGTFCIKLAEMQAGGSTNFDTVSEHP